MRELRPIVFATPVALVVVAGVIMAFPDLVSRLVPSFLYFPERLGEADADPARWGLPSAEQVWFRSADGTALHGWWVPAEGSPRGTAIYFHGNAGHLAGRAPIAGRLRRLGLDVFLFDYRGYGRSEGRPSEEGLHLDGVAAYDFARENHGSAPGRIVLLGHSLGGAVAIRVAAEVPAAGLVATSTFRDLPSIGRALYPWVPGRAFNWSRNRFDSAGRISEVGMPVLVGWGGRDEFIPRDQTYALYEAAAEPKRWIEADRAGHNDLWWDPEFQAALDGFLADVLAGGGQ